MSTPNTATKEPAFINARPMQVRLVSEHAVSAAAQPTKEQTKIELRTETNSHFEIGLDDPSAPNVLNVAIHFNVWMIIPETEKKLVEYEARHEVQFGLISSTGVNDWTATPSSALAPYLAFAHDIALRRAESTLLEMGLRGAALPRPTSFDGSDTPPQSVSE